MRTAALLVAVVTIAIGVVGLASPDLLTTIRRAYFDTPVALYAVALLRLTMGIVVILAAPLSRFPKTLRLLGAGMCLQAIAPMLLAPERARAVLEFEAAQGSTLLRCGAAVALAAGCFLAFAVMSRRLSAQTDLSI